MKIIGLSTVRSSRWFLLTKLLTITILVVDCMVAWRNDTHLRLRGMEDALSKGEQVLTAFADNAERLLDYGDASLRAARLAYQRFGATEEYHEYLAAARLAHSESTIVAYTFSNRSGDIIFDSEKKQVPKATAAGLAYFTYFQNHNEDIPYIDPTRLGRVWKQYLFRIVRPIYYKNQFNGVCILNMRPERLANFIRQFDLGPNVSYSVWSLDHKLIARQPNPNGDAYDRRYDTLLLWSRINTASSGTYRGTSAFDNGIRTYIYKSLSGYPVVVQVGIADEDVLSSLEGTRIRNVVQAFIFGVVTLMFCVVTLTALRKSDAFEISNARLKDATKELQELARTDSLTGLLNRRAFYDAANLELVRIKRYGSTASLLMLDIDHFKNINDLHGHQTGDYALVTIATVLTAEARSTDLPGRLGGEEFVFLLPGSTASDAAIVAERIRKTISELALTSASGNFSCTVSIGVAEIDKNDENCVAFIHRADLAMYSAKAAGRNKVHVFGLEATAP